MRPDYPSKRRYARLTLKEPVAGDVTASHDVHILDLSLGGARVEHTNVLRPGSTCYIRLPLKQQVVTAMGRIVWSKAVGLAEAEHGAAGLLYQSGMEFSGLSREAQSLLKAFLDGLDG